MNNKMKWLLEDKIAHRGYHNDIYPENSMASFRRAIEYGFSIELDVHILLDNRVAVFHDDNLYRMTGMNKKIEQCTYAEIRDLKLLNTSETIPLLQDVLKEINGKVGVMIELKNDKRAGLLEENTYKIVKKYKGKYIIQSFNPLSLAWYRKNAPYIIRGQLSGYFKEDDMSIFLKILLRNLLLNFISKPDFINYDINYIDRLPIKILKLKGKYILGYIAKNKIQYKNALHICDNVLFEDFDPDNS